MVTRRGCRPGLLRSLGRGRTPGPPQGGRPARPGSKRQPFAKRLESKRGGGKTMRPSPSILHPFYDISSAGGFPTFPPPSLTRPSLPPSRPPHGAPVTEKLSCFPRLVPGPANLPGRAHPPPRSFCSGQNSNWGQSDPGKPPLQAEEVPGSLVFFCRKDWQAEACSEIPTACFPGAPPGHRLGVGAWGGIQPWILPKAAWKGAEGTFRRQS